MIMSLVKRDLRGRYKGSLAGFLWNYITPIAQILVYTFVFSEILRVGIDNYSTYLMIGLFPWLFFSESLLEGSGCFVTYGELVKKNYFPRSILPISVVTSKLINFIIAYILAIIIMIMSSFQLTDKIVLLPIIIFIEYSICVGLVMMLASLNVYLRDTQYSVNILLMIWIWITPIMYNTKAIDSGLVNAVLGANPMTYVIQLYQDALYYGVWPDLITWLVPIILGAILPIIGYLIIKKTQKGMAELL